MNHADQGFTLTELDDDSESLLRKLSLQVYDDDDQTKQARHWPIFSLNGTILSKYQHL